MPNSLSTFDLGGRADVVERFRDFAREPTLDLWEGALLLSALVDPAEDLAAARSRIADLAERVRKASAGSPDQSALRRVLFDEEGFCGDTASYDDPGNSSVAHVLAKKQGMPITLSLVTMEIGRRAGLRLAGVGLPGHFVIGGADLPEGLFLDPFDGGQLRGPEELSRRVATLLGSPIELPPDAFAADSPRAILMRVLFNLRRSWEKRELFDEALAAIDCAEMLAPGEPSFLRERGLLLLRAGRAEEALAALDAYVAVSEGEDADAVARLVATVREGGTETAGELVDLEPSARKIFSLVEARRLLPRVQEITSMAVSRYTRLAQGDESEEERGGIVRDWMHAVTSLGLEIKGLWLVDFDSGGGYYCWKYPESALEYFHGYEEGFSGRLPLQ